jgi:UPF0271 protein
MVNITSGFHALNPDGMARTVLAVVEKTVQIGVHLEYNDKIGFGIRSIPHSKKQFSHLVAYQIACCRESAGSKAVVLSMSNLMAHCITT